MIAGMASESAIRQLRIGATDVLVHASWLNTEYEGRFAGLGYSLEETGTTRKASSPFSFRRIHVGKRINCNLFMLHTSFDCSS